MLGGSFWIALLRNAMGAVMIMGIFLLLDRPRFPMKRWCFTMACLGLLPLWLTVSGIWSVPRYLSGFQG